MADVFTRAKRSAVMASIRAENTQPEIVIRQMVTLLGYRFRKNAVDLPGKPDIVIPRTKTIIQVRGCFWHGHACLRGRIPGTNARYWGPKISGNVLRDRRNDRRLRAAGWSVKTIWECRVRSASANQLLLSTRRLIGGTSSGRTASRKALSSLDRRISQMRNRRRR